MRHQQCLCTIYKRAASSMMRRLVQRAGGVHLSGQGTRNDSLHMTSYDCKIGDANLFHRTDMVEAGRAHANHLDRSSTARLSQPHTRSLGKVGGSGSADS